MASNNCTSNTKAPTILVTETPCCSHALPNVMVNVGCSSVYSISGSSSAGSCITLPITVSDHIMEKSPPTPPHNRIDSASAERPGQYRYRRGQPFLTVNVIPPSPSLCDSSLPSTPRGSCDSCPATPSTANFDRHDIRVPIWDPDPTNDAHLDQTSAWAELLPKRRWKSYNVDGLPGQGDKLPCGPDKDGSLVTAVLPDNAERPSPRQPPDPCSSPSTTNVPFLRLTILKRHFQVFMSSLLPQCSCRWACANNPESKKHRGAPISCFSMLQRKLFQAMP